MSRSIYLRPLGCRNSEKRLPQPIFCGNSEKWFPQPIFCGNSEKWFPQKFHTKMPKKKFPQSSTQKCKKKVSTIFFVENLFHLITFFTLISETPPGVDVCESYRLTSVCGLSDQCEENYEMKQTFHKTFCGNFFSALLCEILVETIFQTFHKKIGCGRLCGELPQQVVSSKFRHSGPRRMRPPPDAVRRV